MCLPVVFGLVSAGLSFAGQVAANDAANAAAAQDYRYQIARRDADWKMQLSSWGHKKLEYQKSIDSNSAAADRGYAAEQTRLNELFMQAAFQKQADMQQLIGVQGAIQANGQSGASVAKMDQAALAAFGRNQAIAAEQLTSARAAAIQRNEDIRLQLQGQNNKDYSQVALAPVAGIAPQPPIMRDNTSAFLGLASGVVGTVGGAFGKKAPDAGGGYSSTFQSAQDGLSRNPLGPSGATQVPSYDIWKPSAPLPGGGWGATNWGKNSFNFNSATFAV